MTKWVAVDQVTSQSWTFPINPNKMTALGTRKALTLVPSDAGPLVLGGQPAYPDFSFSGVIYTKQMYDDLAAMVERRHRHRITDHLGRVFDIFPTKFIPEDRKPRPTARWKFNYTVEAKLLGVVS